MPKAVGNWSTDNFGEGRILELDFTDILADGDSVASLVGWAIAVVVGTDLTPTDRILTPPTLGGNKTQQKFTAPATGSTKVIYKISGSILTTNGEPITGWSYKAIIPAGGCDDGC